jgi:Ca-activated chloride channel family protein
MLRLRWCLFCALFIGFLTPCASADTLTGTVREGNSLYHEEKYQEALKKYQEAQVDSPADQRVMFNLGNAQYKLEDYENSLSEYLKSAESEDPAMRAQSLYNAGNALYRMGKLEESVKQYEKALEYNPGDEDAKFNLEFVRQEIRRRMNEQQQRREEEQKQKNQQRDKEKQKQNESGKSQENKQNQDKGEQNQSSDRQKQQEQQQKQQEKPRNEQQEQPSQREQQGQHESTSNGGEQAAQTPPDDMMNPDNVNRYLQAIEAESAEKMKDFLRRQQSQEVVISPKDW